MITRYFVRTPVRHFSRRYFSQRASAFTTTFIKRRNIKLSPIVTLEDLTLKDVKAPSTIEGLEALANDSSMLKKVGKFIMMENVDMGGTLYANNPGKNVIGHQYGAISNRYSLTDIGLQQAFDLGEQNARRALFHCMVNGALEYPASDKQSIEQEYMTRTFGQTSKQVPASNADNWKKGASIDSVLLLGAASYILVRGYPAVQDGDLTILPMLATTLLPHIFNGRALWLPMLNSKRKEFRFVVLGVGQAPIVVLDILNNPTASLLWDTMGESFVYLLENHKKLEKDVQSYITRLHEPEVAKKIWSGLPNSTQWDRYFLEKADSVGNIIVPAKWTLGSYYNYKPSESEIQAVETALKEQPQPPQLPLVSEQEAQELVQDTSSQEPEGSDQATQSNKTDPKAKS